MLVGSRVFDIKDNEQGVIIAFHNETQIPNLMQATVEMDRMEIRIVTLSRLRVVEG